MTLFEELLNGVSWPLVICIWMLLTTFLLAILYRPKPRPGPPVQASVTDFDSSRVRLYEPTVPGEEDSLPPFLTEKRGSLRRHGNPVPVVLANDLTDSKPFLGTVIDRSTTGLRLTVPQEINPGCVLRVRAGNAPDTVPWVYIQVCHVRKLDPSNWEIGCRFSQPPPWNILLLFG
ncbi:MAG TPA: PilZ domain-containing protein [Gemmataceae bacterium]